MGWGEWGEIPSPEIISKFPLTESIVTYALPLYAATNMPFSVVVRNALRVKFFIGGVNGLLVQVQELNPYIDNTVNFINNLPYYPMLDEVINGGISRFVTVRVEDIYNRTRDLIGNWRVDRTIGGGLGDTIESLVWSLTPDPQKFIYDYDRNTIFSAQFSTTVSSVKWEFNDVEVSTDSNVSSTSFGPVQNIKRGSHKLRLKIVTMDSQEFDIVWQFWVVPVEPLHLLIGHDSGGVPGAPIELTRYTTIAYSGTLTWVPEMGYCWTFSLMGFGHAVNTATSNPEPTLKYQRVTITELTNRDALEISLMSGDLGYGSSHSHYPITNAIALLFNIVRKTLVSVPMLVQIMGEAKDITDIMGGVSDSVNVVLEINDDVRTITSEHYTADSKIWHYINLMVFLHPDIIIKEPDKIINPTQEVKLRVADHLRMLGGLVGPGVEFEITLPAVTETPAKIIELVGVDNALAQYGISNIGYNQYSILGDSQKLRPNIVIRNPSQLLHEELNY
jgi:hypothetical protein